MLLSYILRPLDLITEEIEIERKKMALKSQDTGEAVAIHIRRTDGNMTAVKKLPISDFVTAAKEITKGSGINESVVVTDEFAVTKELNADKEMRFAFLGPEHRANTDATNKIFTYRDGTRDPRYDYHSAVLDVFLASKCNYFVGQLSSNYARLIYEMIYIREGDAFLKRA